MSEGLGESLHALGDLVGAIEAAGGVVAGIETAGGRADGGPGFETALDVELPLLDGVDVADLDLDVETSSLAADGTVRVRLVATAAEAASTVSADGGTRTASTDRTADQPAAGVDDGPPAYKDPERLRAVYEAHDSFPEMTAALGVDVTPQTVRRHMIDQGIHEPEAPPDDDPPAAAPDGGATDAAAGPGPPAGAGPTAEGDGPPAPTEGDSPGPAVDDPVPPALGDLGDVTLEELKEAVRSARTIHEVGQRLDVPRERAFRLLNALGLIDLVSGRLRSADRRISAEELEERIERAMAGE